MQDYHLSSVIMDFISRDEIKVPKDKRFQKDFFERLQFLLHSLYEMGEEEHTNDWDPCIHLRLSNGKNWVSENGYWAIDGFRDDEVGFEKAHLISAELLRYAVHSPSFYIGLASQDLLIPNGFKIY